MGPKGDIGPPGLPGTLLANGAIAMNDYHIFLRATTDQNNTIGYDTIVDGATITGCKGGAFKTNCPTNKTVLTYNQDGVQVNGTFKIGAWVFREVGDMLYLHRDGYDFTKEAPNVPLYKFTSDGNVRTMR